MKSAVELFYNNFSFKFIDDYIYGNKRINWQFELFYNAISPNTTSILVIGCGSGHGAYFIAHRIAKKAKILAIDISSLNIELAKKWFAHKRIEYCKADFATESIGGKWDLIILPDVYEHISIDYRFKIHSNLNELLSDNGKIIFTVPSSGKQISLYEKGEGLQIVDEIVTVEDFVKVASDVRGVLTYFSMISVWETNDYIHAIIERSAEKVGIITENDRIPIKTLNSTNFVTIARKLFVNKLGMGKIWSWWWKTRLSAIKNNISVQE